MAFLPASVRAAYVEASDDVTVEGQLSSIRSAGYGCSRAMPPLSGIVLSAVVRADDGLPLGALCTFGSADILSEARAARIGPRMVEIGRSLAEESAADAAVLQRRSLGG